MFSLDGQVTTIMDTIDYDTMIGNGKKKKKNSNKGKFCKHSIPEIEIYMMSDRRKEKMLVFCRNPLSLYDNALS